MKSALRMHSTEADKIDDLKKRVQEEKQKVIAKKEEEDNKREQIAALQMEIAALHRKAGEKHELDEEIQLTKLKNDQAELEKQRLE